MFKFVEDSQSAEPPHNYKLGRRIYLIVRDL